MLRLALLFVSCATTSGTQVRRQVRASVATNARQQMLQWADAVDMEASQQLSSLAGSSYTNDVSKESAKPFAPEEDSSLIALDAAVTNAEASSTGSVANADGTQQSAQDQQNAFDEFEAGVMDHLQSELGELKQRRVHIKQLETALQVDAELSNESVTLAQLSKTKSGNYFAQQQVQEAAECLKDMQQMLYESRSTALDTSQQLLLEAAAVKSAAEAINTEATKQVGMFKILAPTNSSAKSALLQEGAVLTSQQNGEIAAVPNNQMALLEVGASIDEGQGELKPSDSLDVRLVGHLQTALAELKQRRMHIKQLEEALRVDAALLQESVTLEHVSKSNTGHSLAESQVKQAAECLRAVEKMFRESREAAAASSAQLKKEAATVRSALDELDNEASTQTEMFKRNTTDASAFKVTR